MSQLSKRAKQVSPSPTLAITAKANQMKASGIDIISFGAGEPDFDTPKNIKEAAKAAIDSGFTKYTPSSGTIQLKDAIVEKFKNDNGLEYKRDQIVVSCGAKHSLYNVMMALCDPGDEVIIPAPYWVSYPEMVKLADGVPKYINTDDNTSFKINSKVLKDNLTKKTKIFILNSPGNPTGSVYSADELNDIAKICVENNIIVVSDEIYEKNLYDGFKHISIASFGEAIKNLTIVVNGVSKTYAMTGWRIGYFAAASDIAKAVSQIQDHSTSNPTSIAQAAALEAIKGPQDEVLKMVEEFDKRRKYLVLRLNSISGISCIMPKGAFYAFPNISELKTDSDKFADYLLTKYNVAVVPGSGFGAPQNIRLSYATSMINIEKGLDRIEEACKAL